MGLLTFTIGVSSGYMGIALRCLQPMWYMG
uniref:Uncharacterized protein n=1 Tax=Rhizophora mucronata TaxID=61149 RepID=A0A2P2IMY0_RHIMU